MPGIREQIEQRALQQAQDQAVRVAAALDRYAVAVSRAAESLERALR
jgi:hypothetical protein